MKIGYWAIRGRGHPVKNLAHYLDLPYEATSYTNPDDWFNKDKINLEIPFPNLPYLIDDKYKLTETKAIMKYLCVKASKQELLGKTPMDTVYIEQIEGVITDQALAIYPLLSTTDEVQAYQKVFDEKLFPKMYELNKFLEAKIFIAGDYLTWIDFIVAEFLEFLQAVSLATIKANLLEKYANINKYFKNFYDLPKVKEFFAKEENKVPFLPPPLIKIKL